MADTSNGLIYGLSEVKFKEQVLGYIDQNGMQPAGTAPTFMDVVAAQVTDGPVESIQTSPGNEAFTANLIQLKAANLVAAVGGTAGDDDSYTPPTSINEVGKLEIKTVSGHVIVAKKVRVSRNGFANGINLQNVLAMGLRFDLLKPDDGGERYKIYPPGAVIA